MLELARWLALCCPELAAAQRSSPPSAYARLSGRAARGQGARTPRRLGEPANDHSVRPEALAFGGAGMQPWRSAGLASWRATRLRASAMELAAAMRRQLEWLCKATRTSSFFSPPLSGDPKHFCLFLRPEGFRQTSCHGHTHRVAAHTMMVTIIFCVALAARGDLA